MSRFSDELPWIPAASVSSLVVLEVLKRLVSAAGQPWRRRQGKASMAVRDEPGSGFLCFWWRGGTVVRKSPRCIVARKTGGLVRGPSFSPPGGAAGLGGRKTRHRRLPTLVMGRSESGRDAGHGQPERFFYLKRLSFVAKQSTQRAPLKTTSQLVPPRPPLTPCSPSQGGEKTLAVAEVV